MMICEFIERTGYEPEYSEYRLIEESYYEFDGNKDEFCKWWKKAQKSGEWAKEMRLRKQLEEQKTRYEALLREKEETLEFFRPYFQRARDAEQTLRNIRENMKVTAYNLERF